MDFSRKISNSDYSYGLDVYGFNVICVHLYNTCSAFFPASRQHYQGIIFYWLGMGQMTQTKSWGSEVEFIYTCGPRGGSLQILGPGARQKLVYIGRGLTITIGARMWGGAWRKGGSRGLQKQKAEVSVVAYGWVGLEFSFPVTGLKKLKYLYKLGRVLWSGQSTSY